jgi:hypothetical protein
MKCNQCDRPAMYLIGEDGKIPLCLDCYAKLSHIHQMQFLQNAAMMNLAMDQIDKVTGFPSSGGRMPVHALAQAIRRSPTLNNIHISHSQIGVLNTGSIQRIDAAITLTKGSDAEEVGALINGLTQAVIQSNELDASQQNDIIDLTETLAEEVVGKRKQATITAVMKSITEKVGGVAALAGAVEKLWQAISPLIKG